MSGPPGAAATLAIASAIVGTEVGPRRAAIDARWLMAYAAAVGPHQAACYDTETAGGPMAHPLFPVCYEWPLLLEVRDRAIPEAAAPLGVHASHRLVLHRLPRAGDDLTSTARVVAVAPRASGTLVVVRLATVDARGQLVSETDYGSLYRGVALVGPTPAAEGPTPRREAIEPRWAEPVPVPLPLAHVYTECARIWNPIHTDRAVALATGLPGPILHGTATLALAVSRLVARDLAGDCRAVRGIEVRFTGMVPLASTFTVRAGPREGHRIAFEAVDGRGARVLSQGALHL
jgi:acyl dehydratase